MRKTTTTWNYRTAIAPSLVALALTGGAFATADADEKSPYAKADGTWITLSGKVESVAPDSFVLDYGKGIVTVEMDDGDRDADAYKLLQGDEVAVTGRIDDDFFETTTIEASSVHVNNLDTTFFASSIDEEDAAAGTLYYSVPTSVYQFNLVGTVTAVGPEEVTLDTGTRRIDVEVDQLENDLLDDEGYQQLEVGDRIWVTGDFEYDLFDGSSVEADAVVELDRKSQS